MGLRVNTNVAAMNAYRNLTSSDDQMAKSLERLSSGFRINRAADDAAGLSVSENLRAQIGGITVASRNAQDGISVVQTAEGALSEVQSMLQRMRDLSVQAANSGSQDTDAQSAAQTEVTQLSSEIDRITGTTAFGNQNLIDGSYNGTFQIGANAGENLTIGISSSSSATLGVDALDLVGNASGAITSVDAAIKTISGQRAQLGAYQNRFQHTINNLNVANENLTSSESRIRDTDMASEMVSFTRAQILTQAGTAMLAQANQAPQGVLKLLQ